MNIERAQEILESDQTISVMLNGKPIWIEEVFPTSRTVLLHHTEQPDEQTTVSADYLKEQA